MPLKETGASLACLHLHFAEVRFAVGTLFSPNKVYLVILRYLSARIHGILSGGYYAVAGKPYSREICRQLPPLRADKP